jgi:hypothetical protein
VSDSDTPPPVSSTLPPPPPAAFTDALVVDAALAGEPLTFSYATLRNGLLRTIAPPPVRSVGGHVLSEHVRPLNPPCHAEPGVAIPLPLSKLSAAGTEPRHCAGPWSSPYARSLDEPIGLRLSPGFDRMILDAEVV